MEKQESWGTDIEANAPHPPQEAENHPEKDIELLIPKAVMLIERRKKEERRNIQGDLERIHDGKREDITVNGAVNQMIEMGFSLIEIQEIVDTENPEKLTALLSEKIKTETEAIEKALQDEHFIEELAKSESFLRSAVEGAGIRYEDRNPTVIHIGKTAALVLNTSIYGVMLPHSFGGEYMPESHTAIVYEPGNKNLTKRIHHRVHEQLHGFGYNEPQPRIPLHEIKRGNGHNTRKGGVMCIPRDIGADLSELNEGITDYFARQFLRKAGITFEGRVNSYDSYVAAVDKLIEVITANGEGTREEVENKIFEAYTRKTGTLTIGKMINRCAGPLALRMLGAMPESMSDFLGVMQDYKSGKIDAKYEMMWSSDLRDLLMGTSPKRFMAIYPFVELYKPIWRGKDGNFDKEYLA